MVKRLFMASFMALALLAFAGCVADDDIQELDDSTQTQETEAMEVKTYKVGVILPLTGGAAETGEELKRVIDFRHEEINANADKVGYKLDLVYEDGKCDGGASATAFQKLTDVDEVKYILGLLCSSESKGVAPLLEEKGVVAVSATSSDPVLEGMSKNYFTFSYSDDAIGEGIAQELGKYQKVALISEQNDWNQGIKKVVNASLQANYPETEVVVDEDFTKEGTDFRNQLEKIKSSGAQAVLLNPNIGVSADALLKQIAEISDWEVQFVSITSYLGDENRSVAPEAAEAMIIIEAPGVMNSDFLAYKARIEESKGSIENLGGYYPAAMLDAMNILGDLISKHDGDVDKIVSELSNGTFEGWTGDNLTFGGKSFVQGISMAKYAVRDGKAQLM